MENTLVGIGEYYKEDYEEILKISEDRDNLDESWIDWKLNKENAKRQLIENGLTVIDIIVKPFELLKYCKKNKLKVDGESRSQFIQMKTSKLNK